MHRKFLVLLVILVLLVSQLAAFGFVPSVKAQETSSVVNALGTDTNWTEFWQTFKTYAAWDLEWLDRTIWRSVKSDLIIVLNYSKPNHCKVSLVFDASHNAAYRLTFVINRVVMDYVQRLDKFQYELTYDDMVLTFDWSDCASISGLVFTHGVIDDDFWFRIRRNNVPLGAHVVIDPSMIASTSTIYATSYSNQRKTFTAYSKHWVFFSNGTHAVYYYSSDGNTWTVGNDSPLRAATYGYMFSIWWTGDESGTYINFAYAYSAGALNQPLLFRRGKLLANSTISWDAAEQTVLAADASLYYAYPFVCMGIDLYPWIGYKRYEKSVATTPYVVRSSSYSGSWATPSGFPYQLSTWTSTSWIVTISPLTNTQYSGAKAVFYSNSSSKINCQSWTAVVWNSAVQTSSSISGLGSWYLSASAIGNITHLTFLSSLNNKKYTYYNFSSNTFASETSLGIGTSSDNAPVISVNSTSSDIWIMWIDQPSAYSQFYYKLYNNSISSWESDTNYFNETVGVDNSKLISPLKFSGKFGIAYLNGTAAYSVNFVLVEVVVIVKSWHDVVSWQETLQTMQWNSPATWAASLVARAWSSGTSWSFNLLTRQWNTYVSSLHEYYNTGDDTPYSSAFMYGVVWEAQTFTVNATQHTITSVKLKLFRTGSIGIVVASIRKGNGTVPTGPDLTNGTINGDSLTEDTNGLWYEIGLTEYPLISNTQYAIVVRAPNANITNYLSWRCDVSSPTYDNGTEQYSSNSGNSWVSLPSCDMMFEVWGKETMLFSFGLATRTWQPVLSFAFDLWARMWTNIATWVFYPITRLLNDIALWAFNETAMMWSDLSWLFYLLPPLPEWVNVAVWIFSLRSPEWMLVALWNLQLGPAGVIAFLFIALLLLIVIVAGIIAVAYRRPKQ
jgi:Na+-transporting methylmalonyl-CoA/oxaloacetate decarboxylase gamma subunit